MQIDAAQTSPPANSAVLDRQDALVLKQVPHQLHCAQQEINHLRLLNVCLQSTLLRVQTQLTEYLPGSIDDEFKRNSIRQKVASLRSADDHTRRVTPQQQWSFFQLLDQFTKASNARPPEQIRIKQLSFAKTEKQIDLLHGMFYELHTIIHTEHHDRICQLYITLAQTSRSVGQAREVLEKTIDAHRRISQRRMKRKLFFLSLIITFISSLILIIVLSIRLH